MTIQEAITKNADIKCAHLLERDRIVQLLGKVNAKPAFWQHVISNNDLFICLYDDNTFSYQDNPLSPLTPVIEANQILNHKTN